MCERRVNVVGVGNVLMGDDGVGPAAIARLEARGVPAGVHLADAGLAAADVLGGLDPADRLIVIDAVRAGGRPGQVHRFALDVPRLLEEPHGSGALSLHQVSVAPALALEAVGGRLFRDVTVLGVEPAAVAWGEGLSPAVAAALDGLVDAVLGAAEAPAACPCQGKVLP